MIKRLRESPINYWSDLFMVSMVLTWIASIIVMIPMAIYSTVVNRDNSIWSDFGVLVGVPLSAGGAIWLIKCSVQHAMAGKNGKECESDFPKVDDTDIVNEEEINRDGNYKEID